MFSPCWRIFEYKIIVFEMTTLFHIHMGAYQNWEGKIADKFQIWPIRQYIYVSIYLSFLRPLWQACFTTFKHKLMTFPIQLTSNRILLSSVLWFGLHNLCCCFFQFSWNPWCWIKIKYVSLWAGISASKTIIHPVLTQIFYFRSHFTCYSQMLCAGDASATPISGRNRSKTCSYKDLA